MKSGLSRENAIEKLLTSRLRAQAVAAGPDCLEAKTVAAYVERALTPAERLSCEAHLATCLRCQEQVTYLIRLGETDEPAQAVAGRQTRAPGVAWFRWAWAAPALVALVVAGLWYEREFRPQLQPSPEVALKVAAKPVSPAVAPPTSKEGQGVPSTLASRRPRTAQAPRAESSLPAAP